MKDNDRRIYIYEAALQFDAKSSQFKDENERQTKKYRTT